MTTWATKVTLPVGWPATLAANMDMGDINIWFLGIQTLQADGMTFSGTTRSCATTLPDITLSPTAGILFGSGTYKIQIAITNATFDAIPRTFPISGTQGPPGGMYTEQPQLGGLGLADGSAYLTLPNPMAWPDDCQDPAMMCNTAGSFMSSDLHDDDQDMHQGITATPNAMMPYVLPPTCLTCGTTSQADLVYIVLRQELALSGTRSADGTGASGNAILSLFDNHVVGCHVSGGGDCNSAQAAFVDQNRTKYCKQSDYTQSTPPPISPTNQVMGTFTMKQLMNGASCSDVRTALP